MNGVKSCLNYVSIQKSVGKRMELCGNWQLYSINMRYSFGHKCFHINRESGSWNKEITMLRVVSAVYAGLRVYHTLNFNNLT